VVGAFGVVRIRGEAHAHGVGWRRWRLALAKLAALVAPA